MRAKPDIEFGAQPRSPGRGTPRTWGGTSGGSLGGKFPQIDGHQEEQRATANPLQSPVYVLRSVSALRLQGALNPKFLGGRDGIRRGRKRIDRVSCSAYWQQP